MLTCGLQISRISTARGTSLSFQASCSKVSSNTKALPGCHSRRSAPTRNKQPGGTINGRCTMRRVFDAGVRRNVRLGIENGEHGGRTTARHLASRPGLERLDGAWETRDVIRYGSPFLPEIIDAPAARLIELAPLIERHSRGNIHVGPQYGGSLLKQVDEFGANVVGRRFNGIQPGKIAALVELDRRQARKIHEGRLRPINGLLAQQCLQAAVE